MMEERSDDIRDALTNIAQQARSLLQNFDNSNVDPIEQRLVDRRRDASVLSPGIPTSGTSTSIPSNTGHNVQGLTAVSAQLRRLFPTVGNRTSGSKSFRGRKGKQPVPKRAKKKDIVYKDLVLLPSPDTKSVPTHQTRCRLEKNGFVVHGFPVDKSLQEEELRGQIRQSFPALKETEFEFVKSCYGQIIKPKLATGVFFSVARVLGLAGQGGIYIRPENEIAATQDSYTDSPSHSPDPVVGGSASSSVAFEQVESDDDKDVSGVTTDPYLLGPGPSNREPNQEGLNQLREMFPGKSNSILQHALTLHGSVDRAVLSPSRNRPQEVVDDYEDDDDESLLNPIFTPQGEEESLEAVLKKLEKGLSTEQEKLKVDEEDLLNDSMAYYKGSRFDPKKHLRVVYRGQPAVDTGGVTRHFFSQLLQVLSEMFFHGSCYGSPIYSADIVASGLMKYIGTVIVHSILHGGPGFPVLSPSVYRYIATGDIDAAMTMMNYDCSEPLQH